MSRSTVVSFFQTQKEYFWKEIKTVRLESVSIDPDKLMEESTYDSYDRLMVCVDTNNQAQRKRLAST